MIRVNILVEGQTEEAFVKTVLAEYLGMKNIFAIPRVIYTSRDRKLGIVHRGGMTSYERVKNDLTGWMKADRSANAFSTMFDLYGLPTEFPGYSEAQQITNPYDRVNAIENAFEADIDAQKFIPFIQLHEHEALLLSDAIQFNHVYADRQKQIQELCDFVDTNESPEHIDMGRETCPSKQIIKRIPEYERDKSAAAPIIAKHIGIEKMRSKCRHFTEWLGKIESLTEQ